MVETAIRRAVLPPIDSLKKQLFGGFATSRSTEDEYAATVFCEEEVLHEILIDLNFSRSLFSALKVTLDGNVEDGSWVKRDAFLADDQLHVVTHERSGGDGVDIYAHVERSKIVHPIDHYRKVGYDAEDGVEQVRTLLEDYQRRREDAPRYAVRPPRQRSWAWALHFISFVSTPTAARIGEEIDRVTEWLSRGSSDDT